MDLFQYPGNLVWMLLAILGSIALKFWSEKRSKKIAQAFAKEEALQRLFPSQALRYRRVKYALKSAALALIFLALAAPQWGVELMTSTSKGAQVLIAVDTSSSMLAEDLRPNRIEKAKSTLTLLMEGLKGQRIGIIAFAGEAHIQCPLTLDLEAAKTFLARLSIGMIAQPGTDLGKAINLGIRLLSRYPGHKALVLLTDGEDHSRQTLAAASQAAQASIHIYVIGIGTPEGAPIPIKDASGRVSAYKKDSKGQTVISRLGESGLIQVAQAASGAYYRASASESEINDILRHILDLESSGEQTRSIHRYRNRYALPLAAALILLLIELLLPETKTSRLHWSRRSTGVAERASVIAVLALLIAGCKPRSDLRLWQGNSKYDSGDFSAALQRYQQADKSGKDPRAQFNAGAALYKMEDFDQAQELFSRLADPKLRSKNSSLQTAPLYNLGNSLYRKQKYKEAAQAYKQCLLKDPLDENCRYNLALALRPPPHKPPPQNQDQQKDNREQKSQPRPKPQQPNAQQQSQSSSGIMIPEDAERILKAVKEKEKAAQKTQPLAPQGSKPQEPPQGSEDW